MTAMGEATVRCRRRFDGRRVQRLLLAVAMASALAGTGCAWLPWSRSDLPAGYYDPDTYRDLIRSRRGRASEAAAAVVKPPTVTDKLREGDAARASGDLTRAMWSYLHAHKLDRNAAAPVERIAMLHLKEDPPRAQALFAHLIETHPELATGYTGLGLVRLTLGELEEARAYLTRAIELDSESSVALSALGITVDQLGSYDEAQLLYNLALEIRPVDYETLNNLGVSYMVTGRFGKAVEVLQTALLIEHRDLTVQNNFGLALGRMGRYDEALTAFEKAGDEATSMNNLGYVYFLNGRYAEALEHFERALVLGATEYLTVLRNLSMARKSHRENLEGQLLPSLRREGVAPDA